MASKQDFYNSGFTTFYSAFHSFLLQSVKHRAIPHFESSKVLLVPVLGFGPEVEADPLGVLQALVDEHRAGKGAASLVKGNSPGIRGSPGVRPGAARGGKEQVKGEVVQREERPARFSGRGRSFNLQKRVDSQGRGIRHGRGTSMVVGGRKRVKHVAKGSTSDTVTGGSERRTMVLEVS